MSTSYLQGLTSQRCSKDRENHLLKACLADYTAPTVAKQKITKKSRQINDSGSASGLKIKEQNMKISAKVTMDLLFMSQKDRHCKLLCFDSFQPSNE